MKQGGGRLKGSTFERSIAKKVVNTFKRFGIKKEDCYRTPLSGGHIHASKADPGDLIISKRLRKYFPFLVECKSYRSVELFKFMEGKTKAKEFKWVAQVMKAYDRQKKYQLHPLLVMKQNRSIVLVAFPVETVPFEKLRYGRSGSIFFRDHDNKLWRIMLFDIFIQVVKNAAKKR